MAEETKNKTLQLATAQCQEEMEKKRVGSVDGEKKKKDCPPFYQFFLLFLLGRSSGLLDSSHSEADDGTTGDLVGLEDLGVDIGVSNNLGIQTGADHCKGVTGVDREEVAEAQKVGVHDRRKEGRLESNGSKDQRAHNANNLDVGNKGHGRAMVLFAPGLDLAREIGSLGGLGVGAAGREEGGEDASPGIVDGVEEGEHGIGDQRSDHGCRSPPEDGHQKVLDVLLNEHALQELGLEFDLRERLVDNNTVADQGSEEGTRVPVGTSVGVESCPVRDVESCAEEHHQMAQPPNELGTLDEGLQTRAEG